MNRPMTREEKQRQTRTLLIDSARSVFSREGYHAARLDVIAAEAGFTKGAVYSNYAGKPELFLAVMDANLDLTLDLPDASLFPTAEGHAELPPEARKLMETSRGFALATLEFTAAAARDPELYPAIRERLSRQIDAYTKDAAAHRTDNDPLSAEQLGFFLSALAQGTSVHMLAGSDPIQPSLYQQVVERLYRP